MTRRSVSMLLVGTIAVLLGLLWGGKSRTEPLALSPPTLGAAPDEAPPAHRVVRHTVSKGDTLGSILDGYSARPGDLLAAARPHHDLTNLALDRTVSLVSAPEAPDWLEALSYSIDEDRTLRLEREEDGSWQAWVDAIAYTIRPGVRDVVVASSLWQACIDAGLRPADIMTLAKVFQYEVDFNTEIRAGARARIAIDELLVDSDVKKLGVPHAIVFENGGKTYTAIRFERPDGSVGYYAPDGTARKKAFLRSPLEFSRVTSGFNLKRFHPVLKKSRPHYGTDFGAPTGTPVRAVGDGVVTFSGKSGGHGNFVKIDHPGPYETSYSHLHAIQVKKGQSVKQGQVIGTVGSTGLATGPHLHFQLWKGGAYADWMTTDLPMIEHLSDSEMAAFKEQRDRWLALLGPSGAPVDKATP